MAAQVSQFGASSHACLPEGHRKTGLGHTWNALLGWTRSDVLDYLRMRGVNRPGF